jgi:hypothetical protein
MPTIIVMRRFLDLTRPAAESLMKRIDLREGETVMGVTVIRSALGCRDKSVLGKFVAKVALKMCKDFP